MHDYIDVPVILEKKRGKDTSAFGRFRGAFFVHFLCIEGPGETTSHSSPRCARLGEVCPVVSILF